MLFSEPTFLFFFLPPLLAVYTIWPAKWRNGLLAGASLLFYAWGSIAHLGLLLGSIALNYAIGRGMECSNSERSRWLLLGLGVAANLSFLAWFKYAEFFASSFAPLLETLGIPVIQIPQQALPLGISFFTFQAISYIVDVYRNKTPAQRNFVGLALYISLFPQLIAGPIVRYQQIAAQIATRVVTRRGFSTGVRRFVIGLGKKVLIANTLAPAVDEVFSLNADELSMAVAWFGVVGYTLQIYFDFSGYSDMAIGLASMFGFNIPENFRYPYVARSITEFWRRWHISLSTWFRDYVYIPLGGNRIRPARTALNLLAVFWLCGLWHGASWNFLLWGVLHGVFLIGERVVRTPWETPGMVRSLYTMLVVMVGWVIFRTETLGAAYEFLGVMFGVFDGGGYLDSMSLVARNDVVIAVVVGTLGATPIYGSTRNIVARAARFHGNRSNRVLMVNATRCTGDALLLFILSAALIWTSAYTYTPFIYFRF